MKQMQNKLGRRRDSLYALEDYRPSKGGVVSVIVGLFLLLTAACTTPLPAQLAPEPKPPIVKQPAPPPETITPEEEHKSFVSTLADQSFAQFVLDKKLGLYFPKEIREKFLANPEVNMWAAYNYAITEIKRLNSNLAKELTIIFEHKEKDFGKRLTISDIEIIEDWLYVVKNNKDTAVFGTTIQSMFGEGIVEKRVICSPIEATNWAFEYFDPDYLEKEKPWKNFNLYVGSNQNPDKRYRDSNLLRLTGFAWNTYDKDKTKRGYQGEEWENFEEVTDRLNSPDLLVIYMNYNFSYDQQKYLRWIAGDHRWDSPQDTFKKKMSDCGGLSIFPLYSLLKNGWVYNNFDKNENNSACLLGCWDPANAGKGSHTVLLLYTDIYDPSVKRFYTIDSNVAQATLKGPFPNIEKAADNTFLGWTQYIFFDVNANYTKIVNK